MAVSITFGAVNYEENGVITIVVTTSVPVTRLARTDFTISGTGDTINDIDTTLRGSGSSYMLVLQIPPERKGNLTIRPDGTVWNTTNNSHDLLSGANSSPVPYSTITPFVTDFDAPNEVTEGIWDIYIAFNVPITGLNKGSFILEGVGLSDPAFYRAPAAVTAIPGMKFDPAAIPIQIANGHNLTEALTLSSLISNYSANPALQIRVTPRKGATLTNTSNPGVIQIAGTDSNDMTISGSTGEVSFTNADLTVTGNQQISSKTTTPFFKTITGITFSNWASGLIDIVYALNQGNAPTMIGSGSNAWTKVTDARGNMTEAQVFLLRFINPIPLPMTLRGAFTLTLRADSIRGPVK